MSATELEKRGGKMAERAIEAGPESTACSKAGGRLSRPAAEEPHHAEVVVRVRIFRVQPHDFAEQRNCLGPPSGVEVPLAFEEEGLEPFPQGGARRRPSAVPGRKPARASLAWQQCLNFRPLPHGQASFRPTFAAVTAGTPIALIPQGSSVR